MIELITWLVCGIIAAGFTFKSFQNSTPTHAYYNYNEDILVALCVLSSGPLSLILVIIFKDYKYGWGFHSRTTAKKIQDEAQQRQIQRGHGIYT